MWNHSKKSNDFYGRIKIQDGNIYVDTDYDFVTLSYQTNGECSGQEILVPEIAVDALMFGIDFRTKMFNPKTALQERREARVAYQAAKDELWSFQNPVRMDEFIETSWKLPNWGAGRKFRHSYTNSLYAPLCKDCITTERCLSVGYCTLHAILKNFEQPPTKEISGFKDSLCRWNRSAKGYFY